MNHDNPRITLKSEGVNYHQVQAKSEVGKSFLAKIHLNLTSNSNWQPVTLKKSSEKKQ